jgi:pyruvate kinase
MQAQSPRYTERPFVKTKIIATVGPACETREQLRDLIAAGVDLFRLNFAHGEPAWRNAVLESIRAAAHELERPIGILGDLAGPKIRLGELPVDGVRLADGAAVEFVRNADPNNPEKLTCNYERLIDDLKVGDRIMLADGLIALRVVEKPASNDRLVCRVYQPGLVRSRQGVNLPGAVLEMPALTQKDHGDLKWALANRLDYVGLSFVRSGDDIAELRSAMGTIRPASESSIEFPGIVAKIEKMEAVTELDRILPLVDAVMVARGDLGVEVDIASVPSLQKRIVRLCNEQCVPVITATQMLDSMQTKESPTRAEASDVANAVLDGSDAVMLSGETAIGAYPVQAVSMMSRIACEADRHVRPMAGAGYPHFSRVRAKLVTHAVTQGAGVAAQELSADLIAVATRTGRTALAVSNQRRHVPVLALSDRSEAARRMALYWGVTAVETPVVGGSHEALLQFVVDWGRRNNVLRAASRFVLVTSTNWKSEAKDTMLVHTVR